jgi:U6 snRNA-associated Sm-like protein LSm5
MGSLPLDVLNQSINKKIKLIMRKDKVYIGVLREFDVHVNMYLDDMYELNESGTMSYVGPALLNGGTIAMVDIY